MVDNIDKNTLKNVYRWRERRRMTGMRRKFWPLFNMKKIKASGEGSIMLWGRLREDQYGGCWMNWKTRRVP
jgi:hypothetical protein